MSEPTTTHRREWDAPPRFVDSHVHLDMHPFEGEVDAVLERARGAGVHAFVAIAAAPGSADRTLALAERHDDVFATVGVHPHDAARLDEASFAHIAELARHPRAVAIGETGLDHHYDHSPRDVQRAWFERHLRLAAEVGKPVVAHGRAAEPELLEIVKGPAGEGVRGVVHCYTGDLAAARGLVERGWLISFTGVITFKGAEAVREVARALPIERLMIETDAPYLAPVPHRGKRNEPAYVGRVAEVLAELKGLSVEDVARITTVNAERFFALPASGAFKIAYRIRNSLYLNLTNRCTIACVFCGKFRDFTVKGHDLRIRGGEPSADDVIEAIDDVTGVDEVVFCGYGEPTLRLDVLKEVARRLKEAHPRLKVRVNTDGLANLVHGRDVAPELAGLVDALSVSLNAQDPDTYARICPSRHGAAAYPALLGFLASARRHVPEVQATVVTLPEVDVAACRAAAAELGVGFRARPLNEIG